MNSNDKINFLQKEGLLNPKPERVRHSLFQANDFFDPLDLPQVRYEMLRMARVDHAPVSEACKQFGFSREYFYRLERDFLLRGYVSLLGSFRGRRPLIALNQEIVNFIIHRKMTTPNLTGEDIHKELKTTYQVECSRRTVERIIKKLELGKKGLHTSSS
jgi:transposase